MNESSGKSRLKFLGIAGLLLPPPFIYLAFEFDKYTSLSDELVYLFILIYFAFPFVTGIFLLVKFLFQKRPKSYAILILSILNIISLYWLFYVMIMAYFHVYGFVTF